MGSRHNILNCIFQKTLSNVNSAIRLLYFMVTCNFCWNTVHQCFKAKPPSRHWYFESSLICESRINDYIRPDVSNTIIPCWSWIRFIIKECHLKTKCVSKLLFQPGCPLCIFLGDFRTNPTTFSPEYVWLVTESFVPYSFNSEAMRCDEMWSC